MKKANRMKIMNWILIFLCVAFLVFTAVYSVRQETTERNYREIGEDEDLVIASLNVGKADCSILAYQGSFGLIDTGTRDAYDLIDTVLSLNHKQTIDYLIITHYDKDHVGGAAQIAQQIPVDTIYLPDYEGEADKCGDLLTLIRKKGLESIRVSEQETVAMGQAEMEIIPALVAYDPASENDNDASLIVTIVYQEDEWLLPGDIEKDAIELTVRDGKITVDQTRNTVTVQPDGGEPHSAEYSREIAQAWQLPDEFVSFLLMDSSWNDENWENDETWMKGSGWLPTADFEEKMIGSRDSDG